MKVACLGLTAALAIAACATPTETGTQTSSTGDDCAVIAAVAKEHYGFGPEKTLPLMRFEGGYRPSCDWGRQGLILPIYDPELPDHAPDPDRWVSFQKPTYDGQGALIETSAMWGPWAGEGVRCRLRSGFAGWTVERCEQTWIS